MTATDLTELAQRFNVTNRPENVDHMVTVAQLRAALDHYPDDTYVVLAKDPEGNDGYSPLAARTVTAEPVWYLPETTWHGETAPIGPDADGDTHEPAPGDLLAVVLGPVN